MAAGLPNSPRTGDGGARAVSSTQTLSPGGEPQLGRPRFSSPRTAPVAVAHEGRHPMNMPASPPPPMNATPMTALVILEGKGFSRGRCPVSRFPPMEKFVKLPRFLTHNGNSPDRRLFPRNNLCRKEMPPSSDGIGPVRLLSLRYSCVRLVKLPSSGGIGPLRLLPWRRSCERLVKLPSSGGIDPVRLLLLRFSHVRLGRLPSSGGIDPVRLLLVMPSCVRLGRLPSSGGSVPFNGSGEVAPMMRIVRMRCGVPPKVIPCQLVIAVVAFQLRVPVPRRVSFSPQRTLQSAMSPVFV